MSRRSFTSVRSYFFRAAIADIDREYRQYGGLSVDNLDLDDFRELFFSATSQAVDALTRATNRWNPETRAWEQRI